MDIDYNKLTEAIKFYKTKGYKYIEVPWIIDKDISAITKPKDKRDYEISLLHPFSSFFDPDGLPGVLAASGEQGFLQLLKENKLPPGRYITCTPCFRDDKEDDIHFKAFMKVELIDTLTDDLEKMLVHALDFFSKYCLCRLQRTDEGIDIESNLIEIGSYGIREYGGSVYIYGTGCAEPRLSQVIRSTRGFGK